MLRQKQIIINLHQYQDYNATIQNRLLVLAQSSAQICNNPLYIFRTLQEFLTNQKIVFPSYSSLQDIIGKAINTELQRLRELVANSLSRDNHNKLEALLENTPGLYAITTLKRDPRDFSLTELKNEIQRGKEISDIYALAKEILPQLNISDESIKYYASLVGYYSVYKLKRFNKETTHLYLLCFIYHRYQRHYDNLLASFIYHTRRFYDIAGEEAKEKVYQHHLEKNQNIKKAARVLQLLTGKDIAPETPFFQVQNQAFNILEREQLQKTAGYLVSKAGLDENYFRWQHISKLHWQFKRYLRPIIEAVDLKGSSAQQPVMQAMSFLKKAIHKGKPLSQYSEQNIPIAFLGKKKLSHLYDEEGQLHHDRYEFQFYRSLRDRLEAGDIHTSDSVRFRSFEDDLIDHKTWTEQKETLIKQVNLPLLQIPITEHLASLEQELETLILSVNRRIADGKNKHIKIQQNKRNKHKWTLPYQADDEESSHTLFAALGKIDIANVFQFVDEQCDISDAFQHVLDRYVKSELDSQALFAALIAWGTNAGIAQMAQVSDISEHALSTASDNYIRLETLKEANERVSNAIAKLPIFELYNRDEQIHSSSDGQKFETRLSSITARHSPKYFGLKKGVVAYTLVANHIPINARVIGANEHESHYVFDILFNNSTEIQPDIHSTDTHGTNEVNFSILNTFGYQFAPRYKDISGTIEKHLYGFKNPGDYDGFLKPIRTLKSDLIISEWDWIQRIMVSLALKKTTQSIITGKLSSYARQNRTKQALWEYDNIFKSLYLLRYVDNAPLRQNVQLALNRGESYHKRNYSAPIPINAGHLP